jgi:hypothetical protein
VDLSFTADRNQRLNAWNALADLADMAGKVQVSVHAQAPPALTKANSRMVSSNPSARRT